MFGNAPQNLRHALLDAIWSNNEARRTLFRVARVEPLGTKLNNLAQFPDYASAPLI